MRVRNLGQGRNKKATLINVIATFSLQVTTIISTFIVPKLILSNFGSETNGLVSTLDKLLNFVSLIEGGLNGVIMANLYKPLRDKDYEKVGSIVKTSQKFLRRIAYILVAYTALIAIIFPLFFKSSYSWGFVSSLAIILSFKLFLQYCFSQSMKNLLNADKKVYYVSAVQITLIILDLISVIIIVNVFPEIHVLKLVSGLIYLIQPIAFGLFIKKHYPIPNDCRTDNKMIKERWDGLAINTAAFIHGNTDTVVIGLFLGLSSASVYGVYAMVSAGVKQISQSLWRALGPAIGNIYATGDKKLLNSRFDTFEFVSLFMTFLLFSIAGLLITPFVTLYTSGVTDVDYYHPLFGAIIVAAEGIYILREPYVNLAYSANKYKDMRLHAIIEAILNIGISLVLVNIIGITGVAVGTLVAMAYRTIFQIVYLRKNLINRPFLKFFRRFVLFAIPTAILLVFCAIIIPIGDVTIARWVTYGALYCAIFIAVYSCISLIFFRKELIELKKYIKR